MSVDGVAIHRQPYWNSGWRICSRLAPTPESFPNNIYITVICVESSSIASRTGVTNG